MKKYNKSILCIFLFLASVAYASGMIVSSVLDVGETQKIVIGNQKKSILVDDEKVISFTQEDQYIIVKGMKPGRTCLHVKDSNDELLKDIIFTVRGGISLREEKEAGTYFTLEGDLAQEKNGEWETSTNIQKTNGSSASIFKAVKAGNGYVFLKNHEGDIIKRYYLNIIDKKAEDGGAEDKNKDDNPSGGSGNSSSGKSSGGSSGGGGGGGAITSKVEKTAEPIRAMPKTNKLEMNKIEIKLEKALENKEIKFNLKKLNEKEVPEGIKRIIQKHKSVKNCLLKLDASNRGKEVSEFKQNILVSFPIDKDVISKVDSSRLSMLRVKSGEELGGRISKDGKHFEFYTDRFSYYNLIVSDKIKKIEMQLDSKEIVVAGKLKTMDVCPIVLNNKTYLPIRFVAENMDYQVEWLAEERSARIAGNGKEIVLDTLENDVYIINDRVYISVRKVVEEVGAKVNWYPDTSSIEILQK